MSHESALGDRALAELESKLNALDEGAVLRPSTDPHAAAATALLVADYLGQPELEGKLDVVSMTPASVHELGSLSRAIIHVVNGLGGEYLPDGKSIPGDLVSRGETLRSAIAGALEKALHDDADIRQWLEAIRLGAGVVDLVYDLRSLAELCRVNGKASSATSATTGAVQSALSAADALEFALRDGDTAEHAKARATLGRLWTLFVPAYDRAAAAGRVLTRAEGHERQFPPLALVASHRRARRRPVSLLPANRRSVGPRTSGGPGGRTSGGPGRGAVSGGPTTSTKIPASPALPDFDDVELIEGETMEPIEIVRSEPPAKGAPAKPSSIPPPMPVRPPSGAPGERQSWSDTRRANRHSVEIEVGVSSQSNFYLGFTENLSSGGVFVATYVAKPIGSHIEVALAFPNGDELKVVGVVRWLRDATPDGWPGMGVQFESLTPEDEAKIRKFLALRDPLFYDD